MDTQVATHIDYLPFGHGRHAWYVDLPDISDNQPHAQLSTVLADSSPQWN